MGTAAQQILDTAVRQLTATLLREIADALDGGLPIGELSKALQALSASCGEVRNDLVAAGQPLPGLPRRTRTLQRSTTKRPYKTGEARRRSILKHFRRGKEVSVDSLVTRSLRKPYLWTALSEMAQHGDIKRVRPGIYMLA